MKKKNIFLFALAIVLILATSVSGALAYFTTYSEAKGGYVIEIGNGTEIIEVNDFYNWTSHVAIFNTENSQPVYVRARAFVGDMYTLSCSGSGWTIGEEGFYHYDSIVNGGETTSELCIEIVDVPDGNDLAANKNRRDDIHFNMVVIYETTPVMYNENGEPYVDWSLRMESE